VHVYDLAVKQPIPKPVQVIAAGMQLAAAHDSKRSAAQHQCGPQGAHALAFNARIPSLLAVAVGCSVSVWRLPGCLSAPQPGEGRLLQHLAEAEDALAALHSHGVEQRCVAHRPERDDPVNGQGGRTRVAA
jgi:hypothetical protein